jgi:hypothetical protein
MAIFNRLANPDSTAHVNADRAVKRANATLDATRCLWHHHAHSQGLTAAGFRVKYFTKSHNISLK